LTREIIGTICKIKQSANYLGFSAMYRTVHGATVYCLVHGSAILR